MKCPKCGHEVAVGDLFCSRCGTKLESVCPECGNKLKEGDLFCSKCGTKLDSDVESGDLPIDEAVPKLEDMHAQLQSLIPDELAQKYMSAEQQSTGENRPITALFADISGFTPLSNTQSSETMFQLVQDCFRELVGIVARYEGSISGFRGDGLLALFGAPILHENDAERAILAALDMHDSIQEQGLEISVGVNTAMMTVGEIQTQLHREYTAYGTDINLAKRLQEAAQPGQILIGTGTHRLTRRMFDFQELSFLSVKGFSQPVTAYIVQQAKERPEKLRGIEGLRARMIGREHEFADLKEAADAWLDGQGQIVSIIGEAGIGKSRLVTELRAYLGDAVMERLDEGESITASVLEGRCVSIGQPISYWPFLDILRAYFALGEEDDEPTRARKVTESITQLMPQGADETLPLLGNLLSIKYGNELDDRLKFAEPGQIRHQTLMRLRDLFETLARQQPLLLILEDLHWADDLSLDLISLLMDSLANTSLMLLCVYRPEKDHRVWQLGDQARRKCLDRYTELALQPLSSHESRLLVASLLTIDNLPESTKETMLAKSEGNPFFIEEVIRSLIEQDMIYREGDNWKARDEIASVSVPDTIQSVVLARVDRLQSEAKYVLQCASVIGRLFRHNLLQHISRQERDLDRYIAEFEDKELIYEERTVPELEYAFKHAFTQEATYEGILEQRRREFHHQVAQEIERLYKERLEEYYEELAHHYSRSEDAEKTVEYLIKAGEKAGRNYSNQTAISHFRQALETLGQSGIDRDDWRLEALRELGIIYARIGENAKATSVFEEAIALGRKTNQMPSQLARLYFWLGDSLYWQGRFDERRHYAKMGLEILGDNTECVEAALMNSIFAVGAGTEVFREYTRRNMAFVRNLSYTVELRKPYVHIVVQLIQDKELEAAWEWAEELEKHSRRYNDLKGLLEAWMIKGAVLLSKGDPQNAFSLYQKSIDMAES
ncbi:AAA family ATPase, partial [Candidatus Poribacteria bacterium]